LKFFIISAIFYFTEDQRANQGFKIINFKNIWFIVAHSSYLHQPKLVLITFNESK